MINPVLPVMLVLLAAIGIAALYSAAPVPLGDHQVVGSWLPWALPQLVRFGVAFAVMLMLSQVRLEFWLWVAWPFYWLCLGLLIAVEFFGVIGMGAQRWLHIGGLNIQPSEPMKIAIVLVLARFFHELPYRQHHHPVWLGFACVIVVMPCLLIWRQPDLGTALLVAMGGVVVIWLAGVSWKWFLGVGVVALGALIPVWRWLLHDYQRQRVLNFLNPEQDPMGAGYHVIQARIALGSGGWTGLGFGQGRHGDLNYIPEKQTDFILTLIGEEWGFLGSFVLLSLYGLVLVMMLVMAWRAEMRFARLAIAGIGVVFMLYVLVNVGMVSGLAPVVGVPLPLVSYGGTAMITLFAAFGIALSCASSRQVPPD